MKLIVGLGNPGPEYSKTRHNAGFRVLDLLARRLGSAFSRSKFKGLYAQVAGPDNLDLLLLKPQTFMNLSGQPVQAFCRYYQIAVSDLLVVLDDVALPLGVLRLRRSGSHGGHNGLRDIIQRLGQAEFARLRVGVGGRAEPSEQPDLVQHVLGPFRAAEERLLQGRLEVAGDACLCWAGQGVEAAMNKYNAREGS